MADDRNDRGARDGQRINMIGDYEGPPVQRSRHTKNSLMPFASLAQCRPRSHNT